MFKNEVLKDKDAKARKAAAEASALVKNDALWSQLQLLADLLRPVATALDKGQADGSGMGSVFGSFFTLEKHLTSSKYPETPVGAQLKNHCLVKLQYRRSYLLRPAPVLAYLLDPRYLGAPNQPTQDEIESAMVLMHKLASSEDECRALAAGGHVSMDHLPPTHETPMRDAVGGHYEKWRAKTGGSLTLSLVWEAGSVADTVSWWKTWGSHIPSIQNVAVKVLSMPTSFAAGERAFSNVGYIQSVLRTKLSYERLHRLRYIYFNYRSLPDTDVDAAVVAVGSDEEQDHGDGDEDEGSVGSDESVSDMQAMGQVFAGARGEDEGVPEGETWSE